MVDILNPTAWQEADAGNVSGSQPSFPELMPGKNVNDAARAMQGALKRWANQISATKITSGTAGAYTVAYTQAPEALYSGQRFAIIPHVACTAAPTLNINSLGAKTIRKISGGVATDLIAGEIQANGVLDLVYIASLNAFIWINPPPSAGASASPTEKGVIEIGTRDEVQRGTSALVAVVPDTIGGILYKGAGIAGATSISLGDGGYFEISGTVFSATSIVFANSFSAFGRRAVLKFTSAGGILVNSASLILPTAANITVAAGDICEVVLESAGVYRVIHYARANGQQLATTTVGDVQLNKAADQAVTSSTTLVDAADLSFTAKANKTYDIEILLYATLASAGEGGIRVMIAASVALTSSRFLWMKGGDVAGSNSDENSNSQVNEQNVFSPTSTETKSMILIKGTVKAAGSDSVIKVQFAQVVADSSAVTLKADSYLRYRER